MTYSSGGLIQALDYNTFVQGGASVNNSVANINTIWGVGTGDKGYGQSTTLSTVTGGNDQVTATQWSTLIARLNSMLTHQSGGGSGITAPTTGTTIAYLSTLAGKITDANTNRLLANANGTDVTGQGSSTSTWNTSTPTTHSFSRTITFNSADKARYFFNAGGKIIINFAVTNTLGNSKGADWKSFFESKVATIVVGSTTNGRTGTGGGSTTLATAYGYWNVGTSNRTILALTSNSGTADYGGNTLSVGLKTNGVQGSNGDVGTALTFQVDLNDVAADTNTAPTNPNQPGGSAPVQGNFADQINIGITTTFTIRPPSTTNLTDTWGSSYTYS
jgi:hypothetical protein